MYCIAIAILCLVVPWKIEFKGTASSLGYSAIWSPPDDGNYVSIDFSRVVLEIIAITALAAMAFILKQRSKKGKDKNEES